MLFGTRKYSIGVDIGSRSIRLVKLTGTREKPTLSLFGKISLPKGAVSGGEVVDVQAVTEGLQNLIKRLGLRERNVVLGVGNQRVIVRFVDMPYMDPKELASAIKFQAQDFIPIPVEDAIIDYQIVGDYFSESGERFLQIMLVAAHKGMISLFIEAAEKAGLRPEIIDVNAFAIVRALSIAEGQQAVPPLEAVPEARSESEAEPAAEEREGFVEPADEEIFGAELEKDRVENEFYEDHASEPEGQDMFIENKSEGFNGEVSEVSEVDESAILGDEDEETGPPRITDGGNEEQVFPEKEVVAFLDIGADISNLCIVEDEAIKFVRIINVGGDDWTQALVEMLGVSYDEGEEIKIKVGLPPLSGDRYIDVPGNYLDVADRAFGVLEKEIIRFIGEIRRSFEYYVTQSGGTRVTKLIVSGGASTLKNLVSYFEKGLDLVVERRDPFAGINIPVRVKQQLVGEDTSSYTIAIGLALRGFES